MRQFLILLQPAREGFLASPTPEEHRAVEEHFAFLRRLAEEGVVLLAGRTLNADPSSFGLVILQAEDEQSAREIMVSDPAVSAGVFLAQLFPYRVALASRGLPTPRD